MHLLTASYFFVILLSSLIVSDPQEGHLLGNINLFDFFKDKILIEGSAAVAIASAIKMKSYLKEKNVAIIICGGNIGSDTLNKILWVLNFILKNKF